MNILVTGATGFIGGAVVKRLSKKNVNVTVLVRDLEENNLPDSVKYKVGDLRDYKSIKKALMGIDVVINCAGALPYHKLKDSEYYDINKTGTENIVNSCMLNNVKRFIHISTVGIYNKKRDAYANSKLEGERIIQSSALNKISVIIFSRIL